MALIPVTPPAGIVKNGTEYANKGRWVDGDLVRFENGYLTPIKGWNKLRQNPVGRILSGTVSTTSGSFIITITTTTAHGALVGASINLNGFAATGGMPASQINQTYTIASVPSTTTFTINTYQANVPSTAATSTHTSNASEVVLTATPTGMYAYYDNDGKKVLAVGTRNGVLIYYEETWYDITPTGFVGDDTLSPLGFGAYHFGQEDFGDARSQSGLSFDTTTFSFDNFGEILLFCSPSDGKIYEWNPNAPATIASVVTGAPTNCEGVLVTNERHVVALGAGGDPRKIAWSSRETLNTWTASATNTAGDLIVPTGGRVLSALKWQTDVIIFTDTGVARMYYTGSPFIYGIQDAGTNCKAISPRTIVTAGAFLAWMGENSFFIFDGSVKEIPCEVHDYIYDNINYTYRPTSCAGHNSNYNEMWFYFPTGTSLVPNKYVIWNYVDNVWSIGSMDRSCWIDQGVFDLPIACDSNGNVFEHESDVALVNSENVGIQVPFCETAPIEIGMGDNYVQCSQVLPDEEATTLPGVAISFKGRFTPLGAETNFGTFTFDTDGYTDARFTARQVKMKVTGDGSQPFQVGKIRLDVKKRGKR